MIVIVRKYYAPILSLTCLSQTSWGETKQLISVQIIVMAERKVVKLKLLGWTLDCSLEIQYRPVYDTKDVEINLEIGTLDNIFTWAWL